MIYRTAPRKLVDALSDITTRLLCGATAVWLLWQERSSPPGRASAKRCRVAAEECWGIGNHHAFYRDPNRLS
jgi:hypothetical protein